MNSLLKLLYIYYFLNSLNLIQNYQLTNQKVKRIMVLLMENVNLPNMDVLNIPLR